MPRLWNQDWFGWALVVGIGLPVLLVALTELQSNLVRRGSSMASTVRVLRNYVVPLAGLYILLKKVSTAAPDNDWVRITATVLGFLVLIVVLSSLNSALFVQAEPGSWRQRLPSIFIDIVRVIIIAVGLALLFSWVWGTNISGLFAALGVTSLVLGFALQNAVGSIVSGLLLLFEQPFKLGDWLKTPSGSGRIVEVNWRAMHIDDGNGVVIIPNASLAGAAFTNLSRPTAVYTVGVESSFSVDDLPLSVMTMLTEVAEMLPNLAPDRAPATVMSGPGTFTTSIPLISYAYAGSTSAEFRLRAWYASRRKNLTMDDADISKGEDTARVEEVLVPFANALRISGDKIPEYAPLMDVERYARGEIVQAQDTVPSAVRYVVSGAISMNHDLPDGGELNVFTLHEGDSLGQTCLTRQPTRLQSIAATETTVLVVPQAVLDRLVKAHPDLAREIGRQIDQRRAQIRDVVAESGTVARPGRSTVRRGSY